MFLTILFLVILLVGGGISLHKATKEIQSRRTYGISRKQQQEYSWPALEILKNYHSLPEVNRPESGIYHMLTALDVKYGAQDATNHFSTKSRDYMGDLAIRQGWNEHRCYNGCTYRPYKDINDGINEIKMALAEQEHAIKLAGVESGLDGARELVTRLREERKIINNVTKEIS